MFMFVLLVTVTLANVVLVCVVIRNTVLIILYSDVGKILNECLGPPQKWLLKRLAPGKEKFITHYQRVGADLSREMLEVEETIGIQLLRDHVKSYKYDDVGNNAHILLPNSINKTYDHLAESAYELSSKYHYIAPVLSSTIMYVVYNGKPLTTKYNNIYYMLHKICSFVNISLF